MGHSPQIQSLQELLDKPLDGRLWSVAALAADFEISPRKVEQLIETGELAAIRLGKLKRIPDASRRDLLRRLIANRIQELELME